MHHELPARLDLEWYRKQAKTLVRDYRTGDPDTVARVEEGLGDRAAERFRLSDAQWLIAREHGYRSWAEFARWVAAREPERREGSDDVLAALDAIRAGHVARLEALLDARPELVGEVHQGARPVGWAGGEARAGGADRIAIRDLLVERSAAAAVGDLGLAFEREWAMLGERGQVALDSGLRYGGVEPVLVHVSKREGRYSFSDRRAAFAAAGRPRGWREVGDAVEEEYIVNVSRSGEVFLPAVERNLAWLSALPDRIADASVAFYGSLLELE